MALLHVANPPNPWDSSHVEYLEEAPKAKLVVYVDSTRSIVSRNDSPDIAFAHSVNPYRGCYHGCAYCYARPSHEYLSFGAGTDFERRIVIKPEAPRLLEQAFKRRSWQGELVMFSGNTDCYQPLEASYRLTRRCLEVCARFRNPVGVITKSPLIERDVDLLLKLQREAYVSVTLSVPFADAWQARILEPAVPSPQRRFEAIRRLSAAGLEVGVNVAPVIPGLTDAQIVEVLERAREAGAVYAGTTLMRLPGPVAEVFEARLREGFLPERADRVLARIREVRGGKTNDPRYNSRMRGEGPYAEAIRALFNATRRRLGYRERPGPPDPTPFRRPEKPRAQLSLSFLGDDPQTPGCS